MKWLLFNFFIPQKVPMRTSIIIKSTSKFFSASCVLLMAGFTSKKVNYILRGTIQILRSNGIYALRGWWFKLVCFGNIFANFTPWFIARTTESLSVLSGGTLALTRMSFKLFPFLKPIIGAFSNTFLCSLSGVRRRWILNKIFLSFEKYICMVWLGTSLVNM